MIPRFILTVLLFGVLVAASPGEAVDVLVYGATPGGVCAAVAAAREGAILPASWDPKAAADQVLAGLVNTSGPEVKGAHDADFAIARDRAFIVSEANDRRAGESAGWDYIYATLSVVNLKTLALEKVVPIAKSEQALANETLPRGVCFVPRILQKDARTLRCYFASQDPGKRQAQTWYRDFALEAMAFEGGIHKAMLKTDAGTFEMQPQYFQADAEAHGFKRPGKDHGLYILDSFKVFDGATYVTLNNFPVGQNALARLNPAMDTFEVLGHYNEPAALHLTESAVNRLPDGTWVAICRQDGRDSNYTFATSKDGRQWTANAPRQFVTNGANSKPTFDRFGGVYYLGWQDAAMIDGVRRTIFNVDVSRDGATWERKYRFETAKAFQYPAFHEHEGAIYLSVTQGDADPSRKERIMFGRLE